MVPQALDVFYGIVEAVYITTLRMRPKSFSIKVVAKPGVKGESVAVQGDNLHLRSQSTLHVRTAAQQMNRPSEVAGVNPSSSIPCRNTKPEQVRCWNQFPKP